MATQHWTVPSSSGSGDYLVRLHPDGNYSCPCQGWKFCKTSPKTCRHIKKVQAGKVTPNAPKAPPSPFMKAKTKEFGFQKPMLAHKVPKGFVLREAEWAVEEKFDGHRLIVSVHDGVVLAWARSGKERQLPKHLASVLSEFPSGTYDGELTAGVGGRSYDVTNKDKATDRVFVVFDILRLLKQDTTGETYDGRRRYLREIFKTMKHRAVVLSKRWNVDSHDEAMAIADTIWARDGEGVILKRRLARYQVGARSYDFLKIKKKEHAVLTVIGFKPGRGKIVDRGPYAVVRLQDAKGNETSVKVLDDAALEDIAQAAKRAGYQEWHTSKKHPFVGRRLCIDFMERTPDGGYREPRWDRWEDE